MPALRPIDRWFIDEVLPHEPAFLEAARRLERDADAAHDLVQEAFARLFAMDGWASIAYPRQYVLRMLRNMSIERLRRAKIVEFQRISDIEDFDVEDDTPDQFRIASGKDLVGRVRTALNAMPERCRTVLIRRRFDGQPPREIARELGISLSTMEKRLARALVLLSRALDTVEPKDVHEGPGIVQRDDAATG
ncbi:MAG: sigma-70 family RNA polymerase sigma factor [Novosphingobium sp.]|nr:sigma-70 family RNA polymerase sigma factor [Novosphingobium sp.]